MGLFDGKKGLILGVANDHSIAWAIAQQIMDEGGVCGFTHLPDRADDERQRNRRRVAQLTDKASDGQVPRAARRVATTRTSPRRWTTHAEEFGKIDFLLHSIAFASLDDLKRRHDRNQPRRLQDGDGDQRLQPDRRGQRGQGYPDRPRVDPHDDLLRRRKGGAGLQRDGHLQGGARCGREVPGLTTWARAAFA